MPEDFLTTLLFRLAWLFFVLITCLNAAVGMTLGSWRRHRSEVIAAQDSVVVAPTVRPLRSQPLPGDIP
jgi:predicted transporter